MTIAIPSADSEDQEEEFLTNIQLFNSFFLHILKDDEGTIDSRGIGGIL